MPSPFPGMDPYLEDPGLWADVHLGLICTCRELLNRHLLPKYVGRLQERDYVEYEDDPARVELVVPDRKTTGKHQTTPDIVAEPVGVIFENNLERRESWIEVLAVDTRDVVSVIEILSPSNKVKGAAGRESFLQKRREILSSNTHWIEIDLLRTGERQPFDEHIPDHEYVASVVPAGQRPTGLAWPIRLTQRLPVVGIPLRKPDADAPLDLQAALTLAYDRAAYDMTVDYTRPPKVPLSPDLAAWADQLLREKGLRKGVDG
ncbi:hypothetical protein FRUB_01279 [Fimbriiglobus ruber]|uniref:DUF4058 family protein n=2 Tax=Fimbriiglobus ruber TaxID=1908690 RepID=A0A225E2E8_9BACT|nr:hypothetical protein FRUB_06401 [Fimbriiglobus ruber]OWK44948.1 hypothetical protein FRUB_01279 [Fimbriiglobus ruber]